MKSNSEWEEEKLLPQGDVQEVGSPSQLVGDVSEKKGSNKGRQSSRKDGEEIWQLPQECCQIG